MQSVTYRVDQSPVTPYQYLQDVEKYAGNIECLECEARAWYVRGSMSGGRERSACFAAHHTDKCEIRTVVLVVDDPDIVPDEGADTARIVVDLDKRKAQDIMVPEPKDRQPTDTPWGAIHKKYANAADYPINKSLRQILSCLIKNPGYPEDDATIRIVCDGGRIALEGEVRQLLSYQTQLSGIEPGVVRLYWGLITNVNRKDGNTWLNCGDYRTEPSLLSNRPPNPSPRFFQIAAWCAPIFGGHHFKPLSGGFRVSTAPYIPQGFQGPGHRRVRPVRCFRRRRGAQPRAQCQPGA